MKRQYVFVLCVALLATVAACDLFAGDDEKEAVKAAEAWLALVDAGNYGKSWEESSQLFRNAVTKEKWQQSLEAVRTPLGDLVSRKSKTTQYATSLPGAPDGEYVVIQFTTSFKSKSSAVETVTPMKGSDGVWRVSGYYIK